MAQAYVDIPVRVKGLSDLEKLERRMYALEQTLENVQADLTKTTTQLNKLAAAAKKPAGPVKKLSAGFAKLALSIGSVVSAQQLFASGLKTVTAEAQLVSVASAFNEVAEAQAAAARIQTTYNLSAREANQQFAQILARLRPLGIELQSVEDAYGGLATAIKIAGLDAAGAGALFTQVAQGLGSGTVQAEELNTVLDQSPLIVVALAEELGVAAGQIKKLASDGGVSSESLLNALIRVKDEGVEQLAASLDTPAEKIKFFQNVTEDVADKLTRGAIFDLTEATRDFAVALTDLAPVFDFVGKTGQIVLRGLIATMRFGIEVAAGFGRALENLKSGNFKALIEPDTTGIERLKDIWSDLTAPLEGTLPTPPARTERDRPDRPTGGTDGASKAAAEAQKLADKTAERLASSEKLITAAQREGELLSANSEIERAQIESKNAIFEIAEKYGELAAQSLSDAETENLLKAQGLEVENERYELEEKLADIRKSALGGIEEEIAHMEAILAGTEKEYLLKKQIAELEASGISGDVAEARVQRLDQLKEEVAAFEEMEAKIEAVADTIAGSMTNAFTSIVDGSKTAEEALADMMKDIAKSFIDMAADIIKQQIAMIIKGLIMKALGISMPGASGGGSFGGGSPAGIGAGISAGLSYEGGGYTGNGSRSGGVDGMGGFPAILHPQETVVDHTKAMSNYSGGNASAAAASAPMSANITYNGPTLNFNGDDYIPRSEAPALVAAGAKQGQARAMNTLKNSRSQRQKLGM